MGDNLLIAFAGRLKHGELLRALQRKGWNQSQGAKYLGMDPTTFARLINLKSVPRHIPRKLERKLLMLTGKSVDDLFPPELRDKKFLEAEKTIVAFREVHPLALADIGVLQLPPAPDDAIMCAELEASLRDSLNSLTPREEKILKLRFGLEDGREWKLSEVAVEFGSTTHRIRTIEDRALRKLRHPSRARILRELLE